MALVRFEEYTVEIGAEETVLEGLERAGAAVASSCRSGVCHSCVMRAAEGAPSPESQRGLSAPLVAQGYFLSCLCKPAGDLEVVRGTGAAARTEGEITAIDLLNPSILGVRVRPETPFDFLPGQFLNFERDGVVRSYSIASLPGEALLDFHVGVLPGGEMSGWLHGEAQPGDAITLSGPHGSCCYTPERLEQPLLLAGTGTGLAPLYGILRAACAGGHTGPIHLFHGGLTQERLYLAEELRALSEAHPNASYTPCVLEGPAAPGVVQGAIGDCIASALPSLKGFRVFLCGDPELVKQLHRQTFLAGAGLREIFADAFLPAGGGRERAPG